jgi:hypothetical protein
MKKFCDLVWTLHTVQEYKNNYKCQLTRSHLLRLLEGSFLGGRRTKNAIPVLELLIDLKLLGTTKENQVFVMPRGYSLTALGSEECYELNTNQKKLLTSWYISLASVIRKEWVSNFSLKTTGKISVKRLQIPKSLQQWTEEMLYLGVVVESNEDLELLSEHTWMLAYSVEKPPMTLEELQIKLEMQVIAGRKAEEYALLFEVRRLQERGLFVEANRVECISERFVNAGYDILSFSTSEAAPNRFIEVKSVSQDNSFFWSRHELEVSRVLGSQYYLYLVNLNSPNSPQVEIIQNPYCFLSLHAQLEPIQYHVSFL